MTPGGGLSNSFLCGMSAAVGLLFDGGSDVIVVVGSSASAVAGLVVKAGIEFVFCFWRTAAKGVEFSLTVIIDVGGGVIGCDDWN